MFFPCAYHLAFSTVIGRLREGFLNMFFQSCYLMRGITLHMVAAAFSQGRSTKFRLFDPLQEVTVSVVGRIARVVCD